MKKAIFILVPGALVALTLFSLWEIFFPKELDFNADVRPILNRNCLACHGGVRKSGGFSLLFREEALGATESGKPAIIPGKPDESEFIKRLRHPDVEMRMPLEKPMLTDEEVKILKQWIKEGAKWEDHWAFIAPKKPAVPSAGGNWAKNEIDRFVYQKMEEADLEPNPEADKATLYRRVSLDLVGLPPTMAQMDSFLADNSENAYEKAVDKLLASPHYGEKWAGMWLDLARYADSRGYEKDPEREIWLYRDWVIEAFNKNMPYDTFSIEQLAGDLLPKPTEHQLIATGFQRNTMTNTEGGSDDEEYRVVSVIDRVNTVWDVWQGVTMSCVQCHSHPYDPIVHTDYYKFMAFFNNTADHDNGDDYPTYPYFSKEKMPVVQSLINTLATAQGRSIDPKLPVFRQKREATFPVVEAEDFDDYRFSGWVDQSITLGHSRFRIDHKSYATYKGINFSGVKDISFMAERKSKEGMKVRITLFADSLNGEKLATGVVNLAGTANTERAPHQHLQTVKIPMLKAVEAKKDVVVYFEKADYTKEKDGHVVWIGVFDKMIFNTKTAANTPHIQLLKDSLGKIHAQRTLVMQELPQAQSRATKVFVRGNWLNHGDQVQGGVPDLWNDPPQAQAANRLGMAQWLVSKDNPLTARVAVNRFWEQLFGYGIVETLEDFGSQGAKPSHQELLDWLAVQFANEYRWNVKKILKTMVMSATYRQASAATPEKIAKDPRNFYLARGARVRLSAEQVRDQALVTSGLFSPKMYGESVMPPQPEGVWRNVYSSLEWKTSEGEDAFRRSIYTYWRRTTPYPSMATFDAPSREFCVTRRIRTNTPLQALITLNDTVYISLARGLAKKVCDKTAASKPDEQITMAYKMAVFHEPTEKTLASLKEVYNKSLSFYQKNPSKAKEMACTDRNAVALAALTVTNNVILNLDEYLTKE